MALLREDDRKVLTEKFETLENEVKLLFFTQKQDCDYCKETGEILDEIASLSSKITIETLAYDDQKETAKAHGVDKVPAVVVTDASLSETGVVFFGIPSGYEFISLIGAINDRGTGQLELTEETIEKVKQITEPVNLKVFVTPSCPYCPGAVRFAHQLAYLNSNITGEMIEATEFPDLSQKYNVRGVPRTIINETESVEGALPEALFLQNVLNAIHAGESAQASVN